MELRQLEYFCRIADTGSIHEAARRLNLSQPPLSYQLRQLEEELGVRLFERGQPGRCPDRGGKASLRPGGEPSGLCPLYPAGGL